MMKSKVLLSCLGLGAASMMMLSGFDSAATAEDVLEKYAEAANSAQSFSMTETMDGTITLDVKDQGSLIMKLGMDIAGGLIREPLKLAINGSVSYSMLGEAESSQVELYLVQAEDGALDVYVNGGDDPYAASWEHQVIPADTANQLTDMLSSDGAGTGTLDFAELGIDFALAPAPVQVGASSCYQLTTTLTWDDIMNMLHKSVELIAEQTGKDASELDDAFSELDEAGALLGGLKMDLEIDVDDTTYLPAQVVMDLSGTDWSGISSTVGALIGTDEDGNPFEISISAEGLTVVATYDYASPVTIEVPAEAQQVPADQTDAGDAFNDILGELSNG